MAKSKFNPAYYQNFTTNAKGELTYDDKTWKQINARNDAIKKYEDTIKLKQQIQSETEAVILENQRQKAGFERMATIGKGAQAVIDPRMWAKGVVGLGKMIFGQTIETTATGGRAISEQNAATNLYNQSKDLADQAFKIVKTDRPQAEALLKQSQALAEEANKFLQGEATTQIMGADGKLTTKEIIGKSALTALEIGSFAPIGGVVKGSFVLSKTVPPAVQGTKTVAVGNAITRALGLGDIYQVTKTGLQQGLKQEVQQTIVGQAFKSTLQAFITAGLMEMADDDGVNNYMSSLLTTGAGAFGLTLGFGYAGRILGNVAGDVAGNIAKKGGTTPTPTTTAPTPTPTTQKLLPLPQEAIQATTTIDGKVVNLPPSAYTQPALDPNVFEPKAQVIGTTVSEPLPNLYAKLGAFNPETDIPMVDFTETIKANNIDFNPDSTISINATRKAVDDLALLTGNEVGGKKLKINTDDPKYKEIYNNQIKPLVDRINKVDSKVEVPDVKVDPLIEEARKGTPTLPKEISVYEEAKAVGAKRIAPDRVAHQQLTPEEGINALIEKAKKRADNNSNSWIKASETIQNLINKYGDKLPKRTAETIKKYPNLMDDFYKYNDLKKYANSSNLSGIKNEFLQKAERVKWNPVMAEKYKQNVVDEYKNLVKTDISKGYKYPDEVLNYHKSFKTAVDNRARYEKGLATSFSADDSRIVFDEQNRIVAGMKRQDGKELLPAQKQEIIDGVLQTQKALGIDLNQLSKDERWVYVHLNGKNPFLTKNAAGMYRRGSDYASVSLGGSESFDAIINGKKVRQRVNTTAAHEIGHALDGSVKRKLLDNSTVWDLKRTFKPVENSSRGDKYWRSDSEVTARAIEEYVAVKEGHTGLFNREGYWNKEIFESKIKPAVEKAIDTHFSEYKTKSQFTDIWNQAQATTQPAVEKVPVEDVEMEIQKIYSELENAGLNITPEKVRYTPNMDIVDEKLAKGEQLNPDEFNKGMQEYVNSTGKTEVIDGVQEELTGPMKRSAYVERLNKENPGLDLTSVEYQSAIVKDLEEKAINLINTNFDEAGRIARSINKNSNLQEIKIAELYNNKLIELGKYDELAQTSYALSVEATRSGQRTGILQEKKMGTPEYAIKQAQNARINKLKPQVEKEVVKVKQEMSSVKVDQTFLFDILDNITCK